LLAAFNYLLERGKVRAFIDGPFDGMLRRGRLDSRPCHRLVGPLTECGGPEESLFVRMIGNASRLAPTLHGRVAGKLQGQALGGVAWRGFPSKRHLHFFKELLSLRLRKTNDQPNEARQ
jgi:hypothetical protein